MQRDPAALKKEREETNLALEEEGDHTPTPKARREATSQAREARRHLPFSVGGARWGRERLPTRMRKERGRTI